MAGAAGVGSVSPAPLARSLAEKLGGSGADDLLIDLSSHYRESLTPKIELLRTAIAEHARVRFTYYYAKGSCRKNVGASPHRISVGRLVHVRLVSGRGRLALVAKLTA